MTGQLCTCDIDNFGDLLYPIIFQAMAKKYGVVQDIIPLGFFQGPAPGDSGYVVQDISQAIKPGGPGLAHLVIGGGDILRADVDTLAGHYYPLLKIRARDRFWFRLQDRWLGRKHVVNGFRKKHMGYSPIAPFILDKTNHPNVGAVLYCSCGVPFALPPEKSAEMRAAFEAAAFVYVRDRQSRDKLKKIGVQRDIEASPDLVVALSDFFPKEVEREKGLALLAGQGVNTAKDIICIQSSPQPPSQADELLRQLLLLKKNTGAEIVLLPVCHCHGDEAFLRGLVEKSGGAFTCFTGWSIHAIISVLAASRLFIGNSLHGNVVAFSFGVPHLFGPIPVDKAGGFLDMVGLGPAFKLDSWSQLAGKHAMVTDLPADHFSSRAETAKQAVHATFKKIAAILKEAATAGR